ncbi:MAG: hypothetical protein MET45_23205 [Nostoc sp. LLA-1]|nr:hypothetical protein [Cyanocohniella sp. LLY]
MTENIKHFFGSISIVLQDIVKVSIKHKNEPTLGLKQIIEIAKKEGYNLDMEELTKTIITFIKFKKQELINKEYYTKTIALSECSNKAATGNDTYDQIIYNCLQHLDKDFLEAVYRQKDL